MHASAEDGQGWAQSYERPDNLKAWSYLYNYAGDLIGTEDARGCGVNFSYDPLGRLLGEDYVPCESTHQAYSAPNGDRTEGMEVVYYYDGPPPNGDQVPAELGTHRYNNGRLVAVRDRAAETGTSASQSSANAVAGASVINELPVTGKAGAGSAVIQYGMGGQVSSVGVVTGGTTVASAGARGGATSLGSSKATVAGSAGTSPSAIVEVVNGTSCSPVGAPACTSADRRAQMICSGGNVWQWSADCPSGQVCDYRAGLKIGQCAEPDAVCNGTAGSFCQDGTTYQCSSSGLVVYSQPCRSGVCGWTCNSMPDCYTGTPPVANTVVVECRQECAKANKCNLVGTQAVLSGTNFSYESTATSLNTHTLLYYLPAATQLPKVPDCLEVHAFLVFGIMDLGTLTLPEKYWAIKVPTQGMPYTYDEVLKLACTESQRFVSTVELDTRRDEAILVGTTDETAGPVVLKIAL